MKIMTMLSLKRLKPQDVCLRLSLMMTKESSRSRKDMSKAIGGLVGIGMVVSN